MKFEYDLQKSNFNKLKHGINFEEAKELWNDYELIQIEAKTIEEPRYLLIGKINRIFWSAIITYREDIIRIISVRRSRMEEIKLYEEN